MKIEITKKHIGICAVVGVIGAIGALIGTTIAALNEAENAKERVAALQEEQRAQMKTINKMVGAVDNAIDEVAANVVVDIPEKIIKDAMKKAAERHAGIAAQKAVMDASDIIDKRVAGVVDMVSDKLEAKIEAEMRKQYQRKFRLIDPQKVVNDMIADTKKDLDARVEEEMNRVTTSITNQINQHTQFIKSLNDKLTTTI